MLRWSHERAALVAARGSALVSGLSEFLLRRADEIGRRFVALHRERFDGTEAPMLEPTIVERVREVAADLAAASTPQGARPTCTTVPEALRCSSGLELHRLVQEYAELHEAILDAASHEGIAPAPAEASRLVQVVARRMCGAISSYVEFHGDEVLRWAEMSERAQRMRGELLATVAEELRAPLHVINLCTQLLLSGVAHDELGPTLAVLSRNVARQANLVDQLVDVVSLVTGGVVSSFTSLPLAEVVRDAVRVVGPMATAKGVRIDAAGVLDTGEVRGDRALLQQCVAQLLMNAVKLSPPGGRVTASLQRATGENGARHHLQIQDEGPAVPIEVVARLFDPLAGDNGPAAAHDELALALSLLRHIIELHGGRVTAQSSGVTGVRFEVVVPAR